MSVDRTWAELPPATQQAAVEIAAILLRIRERQLRDADKERGNAA